MNNLVLIREENFGNVQCNVYRNSENGLCMTTEQLGKALGYANPKKAIGNLLERHPYLASPEFQGVLSLGTPGGTQETRVFSEDGVYEVSMLSRSEKGREFRSWARSVFRAINRNGIVISRTEYASLLSNSARLAEIEPPVINWLTTIPSAINDLLASGEYFLEGMQGHASTLALPNATKIGYIRTSVDRDQILVLVAPFRKALHTIGCVLPKSYDKLVECGVVVPGTTSVTKVLKRQGTSTRVMHLNVVLDPEAVLLE